jgi:hypothetical protein
MELLITDLTEMGGGIYCVAGWDVEAQRMVRPLPNGNNWATALIQQHRIVSGRLIKVARRGVANGIFPHRTEDTPVDRASIQVSKGLFSDWVGNSAPHVASELSTGFGHCLKWNSEWNGVRRGVHTLPRVQTNSLAAIRVPKTNISFAEAFGKLKATVNDGSNSYVLSVSSKVLKEAWRAGGLNAVNDALPARTQVHMRVGLARPFGDPPKCYGMLNGVL